MGAARSRLRSLPWIAGVLGGVLIAGGSVIAVLQSGQAGSAATIPSSGPIAPVEPDEKDGATEGEAELSERTGIAALPAGFWAAETAERFGIPERVVLAYGGAAIRLAGEQPGCGVDWATLAGIGQIESEHGAIHGGVIGSDGVRRPALYGIPLDGASTAEIADTDGGVLDGDAAWDRAMGPMQIIPDTWREYASDGDDDGASDPQHIDDAALTAARYLCAVGVDLRTDAGWIAAVGAYNDTTDYNHRVAEATSRYRSG